MSRNLSLIYYFRYGTKTPGYGVFAQDTEGYFLTAEEWSKGHNPAPANGVAVITDNLSFIMSFRSGYNALSTDITVYPNLTEYALSSDLITDYDGKGNTLALVEAYGNNDSHAAGYCVNHTFPNGKKGGYLPSGGEFQVAVDNREAINEVFMAVKNISFTYSDALCSTLARRDSNGVREWYHYRYQNRWLNNSADSNSTVYVFATID